MSGDALVSRSVRDFVAAVASVDEPVPAGGSVAALMGAACAALLALACGVQLRKVQGTRAEGLTVELHAAQRLQAQLLGLVDEDAAAFAALVQAKRAANTGGGADEVRLAAGRTAQVPLAIAVACAEVLELSGRVEQRLTRGFVQADVRAARVQAGSALEAALGLAEADVALLEGDAAAQVQLREQIAHLRVRVRREKLLIAAGAGQAVEEVVQDLGAVPISGGEAGPDGDEHFAT